MVKKFTVDQDWALILGGSSGLGLASALKLARHGMNICIVHRNSRKEMQEVNEAFAEIRAMGGSFMAFNEDVCAKDNMQQITSELSSRMLPEGKVRCLLHSIAKGNLKPMVGAEAILDEDDFKLTIQYMALSLYSWTREVFSAKLFASDARVLAFTSEGSQKALSGYAAVAAAKASLEAIVRNIAREFAPFGVRANCIQAGMTNTNSFRKIPGSDQLQTYTQIRNPFGRMTTPEDIANIVYLLCKEEAAWINGTVIIADGGEHIC